MEFSDISGKSKILSLLLKLKSKGSTLNRKGNTMTIFKIGMENSMTLSDCLVFWKNPAGFKFQSETLRSRNQSPVANGSAKSENIKC